MRKYGEGLPQKSKRYHGRPCECEKLLGIRVSVRFSPNTSKYQHSPLCCCQTREVWITSKEDANSMTSTKRNPYSTHYLENAYK